MPIAAAIHSMPKARFPGRLHTSAQGTSAIAATNHNPSRVTMPGLATKSSAHVARAARRRCRGATVTMAAALDSKPEHQQFRRPISTCR